MNVKTLAELQAQREEIVLKKFDENDAWAMGVWMHERSAKENHAIAISISINRRMIFKSHLPGTTAVSDNWLRRKENTVYQFYKSSYEMARMIRDDPENNFTRYGFDLVDYALAGGGVPLIVEGVGCVGCCAITGLSEEDDHALVVDGIKYLQGLQK